MMERRLRNFLDVILTRHPRRTCLGALFGVLCAALVSRMALVSETGIALQASCLTPCGCLVLGILISHIRTVYDHARPAPLFAAVESVIELIGRSDFSESDCREHRRRLIAALLERVADEPAHRP